MKKYSISSFAVLLIVMMTFQVIHSQSLNKKSNPNTLTITMEIDYSKWTSGNWYEAISFSDSDPVAEKMRGDTISKRRGRSFNSKVKRNQELKWISTVKNAGKSEINLVLVSITRHPDWQGETILTQPWYNSVDGGKSIIGLTRVAFRGGAEEHYIISFAVSNGNGGYDTYTIDPIVTGHL